MTREDHERLKAEVLKNDAAAFTWGSCLLEICESESYRFDGCESFAEWTRKFCNQSSESIKKLLWRERQKRCAALVADTTQEKPADQVKPYAIVKADKLINRAMARLDTSKDIEIVAPPPVPVEADLSLIKVIPADVITSIHILARDASVLLKEGYFALNEKFRHLARVLQTLDQKLYQQCLPGFEQKQKSRGTRDEVREFFTVIGLPASDADWFFDKCEGCKWTNNKQPISDWRATVRAWNAAGQAIFPSKKAAATVAGNGKINGAELIVRQKELERCEELLKNIRERYSSADRPWSKTDTERYNNAQARRKELKQILGIQI